MSKSITGQISKMEFIDANIQLDQIVHRDKAVYILYVGGILAFVLGIYRLPMSLMSVWQIIFGICILVGVVGLSQLGFLCLGKWVRKTLIRRKASRLYDQSVSYNLPYVVTWDEVSLEVESNQIKSKMLWTALNAYAERSDYFFLFQNEQICLIFLKKWFERPDDLADFTSQVVKLPPRAVRN